MNLHAISFKKSTKCLTVTTFEVFAAFVANTGEHFITKSPQKVVSNVFQDEVKNHTREFNLHLKIPANGRIINLHY